jgi:hypothetical protein
MLSTYTTRLLKPLTLAFAVAALAIPVAQAQPAPAGKYGPLDPWAYNLIHRSVKSPSTAENYGGPLDPIIANAIRNHSRGQSGFSKSAAASVPAAVSSSFDWGAAGIGAGVALATVLLGLGLARLTLRRSRTRFAGI